MINARGVYMGLTEARFQKQKPRPKFSEAILLPRTLALSLPCAYPFICLHVHTNVQGLILPPPLSSPPISLSFFPFPPAPYITTPLGKCHPQAAETKTNIQRRDRAKVHFLVWVLFRWRDRLGCVRLGQVRRREEVQEGRKDMPEMMESWFWQPLWRGDREREGIVVAALRRVHWEMKETAFSLRLV